MKVLITGVAGFIGSNLCKKLLNAGIKCSGIDKLTDYYDIKQKRYNLKPLLGNSNFTFYEKDILKYDPDDLIKKNDFIIHLAAQSGVFKSWGKNFNIYVNNNLLTTQLLLETLIKYPKKKLIFASSSSIYGNTNKYPMREDNLLNPISPYGLTKLSCEKMIELYNYSYGINYLSLRFFTVYGPAQRPDMAFHKFFKSIVDHKPIYIYGDGNQVRDFTFVEDVTDFIKYLIISNTKWNYSLNVGGGHKITVNEVIDLIFSITGQFTILKHTEDQKGDMRVTHSDITLARQKFSYNPKYNIEQGLKEEWEWIQNYYSANV